MAPRMPEIHSDLTEERKFVGARREKAGLAVPMLLQNRKVAIGLLIVVALCVTTYLLPFVWDIDPYRQDLINQLKPPGSYRRDGGLYLLGTDHFGRDVFARLVYGVRVPLYIASLSAFLGALMGLAVGLPAGYVGGVLDRFVNGLIDVQLSLPFILVALFILVVFGASVFNIVIVFTLLSWPLAARVARGEARRLRSVLFIEACRSMGFSTARIIYKHILPNAIPPVLVVTAVQVAHFVITEAALGFFGLGVAPPEPTWGNMLADARNYMNRAWWLGLLPGLAIILLAMAANSVGEGLREYYNPQDRNK